MFKNRVRTAALAGAIAVATGVSGLTVPAIAQEAGTTNQTGNGTNLADGSKTDGNVLNPTNRVPEVPATDVHTELEKRASDIKTWINKNEPADELIDYGQNFQKPEQTRIDEIAKHQTAVTEELRIASELLGDIEANIDIAKAQAAAAKAAWKAYAESVALNADEADKVNAFIKDNDLTKYGFSYSKLNAANNNIEDARQLNDDGTRAKGGLLGQIAEASRKVAQNDNGNKADAAALAELDALVRSFLTGDPDALRTEAIKKTGEAERRNVTALEDLYPEVMAQVRTLRLTQAYYDVAARYYGLYEDDTLRDNEKNTLRAEYLSLLDGSADDLKYGLYTQTKNALIDFDDDSKFQDVAKSRDWEVQVSRVRSEDLKYRNDAATEAEARQRIEEERKANEEYRQKLEKALADIAAALAAQQAAKETPAPSETTKPSEDNKGGSTATETETAKKGLTPAGIAGIVIGVLALIGGGIAAAYPAIKNALPANIQAMLP